MDYRQNTYWKTSSYKLATTTKTLALKKSRQFGLKLKISLNGMRTQYC